MKGFDTWKIRFQTYGYLDYLVPGNKKKHDRKNTCDSLEIWATYYPRGGIRTVNFLSDRDS